MNPSLLVLLPLLDLFALLDLLDDTTIDNYLSQTLSQNLGPPVLGITEKLRTFNLHMGQKKRPLDRGVGPRNDAHEDASDLGSLLELEDDDADLTFKFSSKVNRQPAFLSLLKRLASHDHHLVGRRQLDMPVIMLPDKLLPAPELADVPAGLMMGAGLAPPMAPSVLTPPVIYSTPALPGRPLEHALPMLRPPLLPQLKPRTPQRTAPVAIKLPLATHVTTFASQNSSRKGLALTLTRPGLPRANSVLVAMIERKSEEIKQ